jgi:hypothetical protein
VVYHGTASVFDRFNTGRGAIYFTSDPEIASIYADHTDAYDAHGDIANDSVEPAPNVIQAILSITRPLVLDEAWAQENLGPAGCDRDWVDFDSIIYSAYQDGECDGVILKGVMDFAGFNSLKERVFKAYDQYIIFHPRQVKSAIGNSGRFDPHSNSLSDHPYEECTEEETPRERMAA